MEQNNPYSYADITRYLNQQMTESEMHAFEKAMMEDPMLADAVEGATLSLQEISEKHLSNIKETIAGKKSSARMMVMPTTKSSWWRVAAIVFIIASGSILTYTLLNTSAIQKNAVQDMASASSSASLPTQERVQAQGQAAIPENVESETFKLDRKDAPVIAAAPPQKQQDEVEAPKVATDNYSDENKANNPTETLATEAPLANITAKEMKDDFKSPKIDQQPSTTNTFKGKVTDNQGMAIPFATLRSAGATTSADAEGNFNFKAPDSIVKVEVSSAGYAAMSKTLNSNISTGIVLQENQQSLSEVVVTKMQSRKKSAAASPPHNIPSNNGSTAEPVGGWNYFKQYVNRSVDSLEMEDGEIKINGIAIEFIIDSNGDPSHIKVNDAPTRAIREKAADIIKKGPKWSASGKEKKVKMSIPF